MIDIDPTRPLLVFGGPYSNLRATRALREEARRLAIPPGNTICTGDVVAYCAEPEETVALVRDWGIQVVAGNCEESLAAESADCGCNFEENSTCNVLAKNWFEYASARVSRADRAWMGGLPSYLRVNYGGHRLLVVHGGKKETARWIFASDEPAIREELALAEADVVLAGHCGLPFARAVGGRLWFNPGVVGMPANDGDPRVWLGLMTARSDGSLAVETRRLAYDHDEAARSLRAAGYAEPYARALETGLWPSLDILPVAERAMIGRPIAPVSRVHPGRVTLAAE